jgi:hypothetical protein
LGKPGPQKGGLVFFWLKIDVIVKSGNKTPKKKDPDARRANPEE